MLVRTQLLAAFYQGGQFSISTSIPSRRPSARFHDDISRSVAASQRASEARGTFHSRRYMYFAANTGVSDLIREVDRAESIGFIFADGPV